MKLSKITIQNFRSIESLEFNIHDFTSLVGQNNCGKSSILQAVFLFLKGAKPDHHDWRKEHEEEPIIIIGEFTDLQNWERVTPGISGLIDGDQITLRYTAFKNEEDKIEVAYDAFKRQMLIDGWSDSWADLRADLKEIAAMIPINGANFRGAAGRNQLKQYIETNHAELVQWGDANWTSENISIAAALKQGLPIPVIIPAVRDASDEGSSAAKSSFGTLIQQLLLPAITETDEYKEFIEAVAKLNRKLSGDGVAAPDAVTFIETQITQRLSNLIQASAKIRLNPPEIDKFIGANTTINLNDGVETKISFQGHGLQRTLILALLEVIAQRESTIENEGAEPSQKSIVLLFEEPELYLHPHLMRMFKKTLLQISESTHWQVIITTHSPILIDVVDNPKSLVIINRATVAVPPQKVQLENDPFDAAELGGERQRLRASLDFHPSVNEVFFAKQVVLVEGDTELTLFRHRTFPYRKFEITDAQYETTTVVSCAGKWTIIPIARLLNQFGIPYRVVHDIDRKGRSQEQLDELPGFHPYNANEKIVEVVGDAARIFAVNDTLEHFIWDPAIEVLSKDKPYKAWEKINDFVTNDNDTEIFDLPQLRSLYQFVFRWD